MKVYEVKAFVMVQAPDERRADLRAAELLDQLPSLLRRFTRVEGDHEVYEVEEEDIEWVDAWPWRYEEGEEG